MTCECRKENGTIRVNIDFLDRERDYVDRILSTLLCDYRKSFEKIVYTKDPETRTWWCEFHIRKEDQERLGRLLKRVPQKR